MTNNIKAQVFAMYWGCSVVKDKHNTELFQVSSITFQWIDDVEYLLLRSISMLKDEEAVEVAKLVYPAQSAKDMWEPENGKSYLYNDLIKPITMHPICSDVADYLRSIGIALPVTVLIDGKPTTYSVADLDREGVIKIVEG